MIGTPHRIDPFDCGCTDCITGWSRPFISYGDAAQFHALLHQDVQDATGDGHSYRWMDTAAEHCPQRFAEEFRAKRLLSRQRLQAKVATTLLGTLFDD